LKHEVHEDPHRDFTAKIAKNAKNIALLSHRTIAASHRIVAGNQPLTVPKALPINTTYNAR